MTLERNSFYLNDNTLRRGTQSILRLDAKWFVVDDASDAGVFLRMRPEEPAPYVEHALGNIVGLQRFVSMYRFSPFWMKPGVGTTLATVHPETLWLLAQTASDSYTMVVPLLDDDARYSLRIRDDALAVVAETGDPALSCVGGIALFVAVGADPYLLVAEGAKAVQQLLAKGRLRRDKALPDFVDLFGWCTWDAFYKDVSADKVVAGLASFQHAGVSPRWLILDDGWQQWQRESGGEDRLTNLDPNERFGGDLTLLVNTAKTQFGVQRFLVWHALLGYWGGMSEQAFADFGVRSVGRSFGPGILEQEPRWNVHPWGAQIGVPSAHKFAQFYETWHGRLAAQGVDGVKVDAQALLESVSAGQGGRVAMATVSRSALEDSVTRHFDGRLINCMCSGSEGAYLSTTSSLMRSSDDFFPNRSESHGLHLHVNAMVGVWFGEFMQPDWDMFQSAHPRGAFHAAARALSGGPVYVSDKVGAHDADVLRKLVLSDGTVLRADLPGRPTRDSLFTDPILEPILLKVFNRNRDCGVVGLFNACTAEQTITGFTGPDDVEGLRTAISYAAWAHCSGKLWITEQRTRSAIMLEPGAWEIVSFAPIERGFAALGLADKFNSTGAILERGWQGTVCTVRLRDGGKFLGWAAISPHALQCDGKPQLFTHDPGTGRLCVEVATGGPHTLCLHWD